MKISKSQLMMTQLVNKLRERFGIKTRPRTMEQLADKLCEKYGIKTRPITNQDFFDQDVSFGIVLKTNESRKFVNRSL